MNSKAIRLLGAFALATLISIQPVAAMSDVHSSKSYSGNGTYKVGKAIKPGIYVSKNSQSAFCYWATLSGFSGKLSDISASDIGGGQAIVEIQSTDKGFKSNRCGKWSRLGTLKNLAVIPGNGTFSVGDQIAPGTYQSTAKSDMCYWATLSGFTGTLDQINASDIAEGPQIVEITDGDVGFKTSRCGSWKRID